MSSEHVKRRLATILAADVVGSCRLIGINEEGTLAQLKALRKTLFDPKIAGHHGRIVKNTGDGALVEFASVVDAVRCADEIQRSLGAPMMGNRNRGGVKASAVRLLSLCGAFGAIALLGITVAKAQDAEPRSYSNTPVGLNFLIAGALYSQGKLAFDPNLSVADANFHSKTGLLVYVRSFDFVGQSAKFDVIVPASSFSASGLVDGQPRQREMAGLGDPRFRVSVNLIGAPALSVKEFANYRQDLIVGVSLQVSAPLGQYDSSKLLNLGNNRWSFKPELGISKAVGSWTFELAPSVTFFTDNNDFFGGNNFAQAPFYAVQGHILYTFQSGAWFALDGVYFSGGRTSLNGVKSDNEQRNTRAGFTVAFPIDRQNSLKLSASTGITSRTGSEFTAVGVAWQYRWGEGY